MSYESCASHRNIGKLTTNFLLTGWHHQEAKMFSNVMFKIDLKINAPSSEYSS